MSARANSPASHLVFSVIIFVALMAVISPEAAATQLDDANTDTLLRMVNIPSTSSAFCSSPSTALAIVQASKAVSNPSDPNSVFLVTSCFSSTAAKRATLYFLDPSTPSMTSTISPGSVVTTIVTGNPTNKGSISPVAPGQGWAELVLVPDRGVLFG